LLQIQTVESLTNGTSRKLVPPAERDVRRSGRSATGTSGLRRTSVKNLLYRHTATLYSIHLQDLQMEKTDKVRSDKCMTEDT